MAITERKLTDGSVKYQARVRGPDGLWLPSVFRTDRIEAESDEIELRKLKRQESNELTQDARKTSVNAYWEVWSIENRAETSAGWKQSQDQMFRDYIAPVIGVDLLSKVTPAKVGRVLSRMRDPNRMPDGVARSPSMVLKVYVLLHQLFGDAKGYWRMDLESPVLPSHHRPRVKESEQAFLQPGQSWALLDTARRHYLGPLVWLELLAGLRTEAAVALKWDSVCFTTNQITIRRAWKRKVQTLEEYPKGGRQEIVPLVPLLREYLLEIWTGSLKNPDSFVCQSVKGLMVSPSTYAPNLRKLCAGAGVPRVSPHQLRHSCTELFVSEGANAEDIRRLLNHKSTSVTKRYMHRTDERLAGIAARVVGPRLRVVESRNVPTDVPIWEQRGGLLPQSGGA